MDEDVRERLGGETKGAGAGTYADAHFLRIIGDGRMSGETGFCSLLFVSRCWKIGFHGKWSGFEGTDLEGGERSCVEASLGSWSVGRLEV